MQLKSPSEIETFAPNEYTVYLEQLNDRIQMIQHYIFELENQQASISKRRYMLKSDLFVNLFFLLLFWGIYFFLRIAGLLDTAIGFISGCVLTLLLLVFSIYLIHHILKAAFILGINSFNNFFQNYTAKKHIHTLLEEDEFCSETLKTYHHLLGKLKNTVTQIRGNAPEDVALLSHAEINALLTAAYQDFPQFQYDGNRLHF